jgi:hypothetical protein
MNELTKLVMTRDQMKLALTAHRREVKRIESLIGCKGCDHWVGGHHGCQLAGGAMPPPEVITDGCDSWKELDIPF